MLASTALHLLAFFSLALASPAPAANPDALAEPSAFANPEPFPLAEANPAPNSICVNEGGACAVYG